jgi:hypothetical protein
LALPASHGPEPANDIQPNLYGDRIMKHKMIALILALTVVPWAQTVTQTTPSTPQQSSAAADKGKCCDKMAADPEDAPASCAHHRQHTGDGKEMAGRCSGKHKDAKSCSVGSDAKSCMKGDKDKSACYGESCRQRQNCGHVLR